MAEIHLRKKEALSLHCRIGVHSVILLHRHISPYQNGAVFVHGKTACMMSFLKEVSIIFSLHIEYVIFLLVALMSHNYYLYLLGLKCVLLSITNKRKTENFINCCIICYNLLVHSLNIVYYIIYNCYHSMKQKTMSQKKNQSNS